MNVRRVFCAPVGIHVTTHDDYILPVIDASGVSKGTDIGTRPTLRPMRCGFVSTRGS